MSKAEKATLLALMESLIQAERERAQASKDSLDLGRWEGVSDACEKLASVIITL